MPGRHHSWSSQLAVALLAACCSLLAACGEDAEDSTSAPEPPATAPGGLSVVVDPPTAGPGSTVQASVRNETEKQFTYGAAYELEREVDGSFELVELPQRAVIEIAYVAPPGESGAAVEVELPDDLEPGTYRVVIQRDVPGVGDLAGEFEVTDAG